MAAISIDCIQMQNGLKWMQLHVDALQLLITALMRWGIVMNYKVHTNALGLNCTYTCNAFAYSSIVRLVGDRRTLLKRGLR
jgi:hypothetical protein